MKRSHAAGAPEGLRASTFHLDGELLVLSYPVSSTVRLPAKAKLSKAEREVLLAVLGGLTNAEIALQRGRSVSTIENQVAPAFRKLGVSTRGEAAALLAGSLASPS